MTLSSCAESSTPRKNSTRSPLASIGWKRLHRHPRAAGCVRRDSGGTRVAFVAGPARVAALLGEQLRLQRIQARVQHRIRDVVMLAALVALVPLAQQAAKLSRRLGTPRKLHDG